MEKSPYAYSASLKRIGDREKMTVFKKVKKMLKRPPTLSNGAIRDFLRQLEWRVEDGAQYHEKRGYYPLFEFCIHDEPVGIACYYLGGDRGGPEWDAFLEELFEWAIMPDEEPEEAKRQIMTRLTRIANKLVSEWNQQYDGVHFYILCGPEKDPFDFENQIVLGWTIEV